MDIMLVNIIDIVISEDEEADTVETQKLYLPTLMYKKDIERVHPGVAATGRLYKNIATIKTYSGDSHTVVGNYKDISNRLEKIECVPKIGYNEK